MAKKDGKSSRLSKRRYRYNGSSSSSGKGDFRKASWGYMRGAKFIAQNTKTPFSKVLFNSINVSGPLIHRSFRPQAMVTNHRYVFTGSLTNDNTTGLTGTETAFRLNSLFDPDATFTGHQPLGFDQMSALYTNYRVFKVQLQVRVMAVDGGAGPAIPYVVAQVRAAESGVLTTGPVKYLWEVAEQPNTTIISCGNGVARDSDRTWDASYYIADIEGKPRAEIFNDNRYAATTVSNPALFPVLTLACGSINETPGATVRVMVSFVFHTVWQSPRTVGTS